MKKITYLLLVTCGLFTACSGGTGHVKTVDPNDETPPKVSLNVSALDPDSKKLVSRHTEGDNPLGGQGGELKAIEDEPIIIIARANDPSGVKKLEIWNIGAPLTNMDEGEITSSPNAAFSTLKTNAVIKAPPGARLALFATSNNFGDGLFGSTTSGTGRIYIDVAGTQPPLINAKTQPISFVWDTNKEAYISQDSRLPSPNAYIVGVSVGNVFNDGSFISLYRGDGDIINLNMRTDFVRMLPDTRADFFNGPWKDQPWYGRRGNRSSPGGEGGVFTIDVHYVE